MAVGSVEVVRDYDLKSKSIGVRMSELGSESGGAPSKSKRRASKCRATYVKTPLLLFSLPALTTADVVQSSATFLYSIGSLWISK